MKFANYQFVPALWLAASSLLIASIAGCRPSPTAVVPMPISEATVPGAAEASVSQPTVSGIAPSTFTPTPPAVVSPGPTFEEALRIDLGMLGGLDWSPNGEAIAASTFALNDEVSSLTLFDVTDGRQKWSSAFDYGERLAFSPDGAVIAVPHPTKDMIQLFDAENGSSLGEFTCGKDSAECNGGSHIAYLPDGAHIVTATLEEGRGTVYEWDVSTGSYLRQLARTDGTILGLSMSPTGEWFTTDLGHTGSGETVVSAWAYPSGELKCTWPGRTSAPLGPKNTVAVTTGEEIVVLSVETCESLETLSGSQWYIAADATGGLLAALSLEGLLTLYDLGSLSAGTAGPVQGVDLNAEPFKGMRFSGDGTHLAVGEEDGIHIMRIYR